MSLETEQKSEPVPVAVATPSKQKAKPRTNISSGRESIESFVFVFLFFLVLGVQAEGFIIPTGSMAPTLMGRHKEITCPDCGEVYSVNADREISQRRSVDLGTCVNCRYTARLTDEPNFQGDRIYVMKTPISIPFLPSLGTAKLERWDIAVFKLPEEPEVRYIKRMVGIGGETLRILRGDLWVRPLEAPSTESFHRVPRPLPHQEAMQMPVYNDTHRPRSLNGDRRWARWSGEAWNETPEEPGTFRVEPSKGNDWAELRYSHIVPDPAQWSAVIAGDPLPHPPRATLITDFYSYNTDQTLEPPELPRYSRAAWRQPHWVGDLAIRLNLDVKRLAGKVRFELVKAGVTNRVEIDLASGMATLVHGDAMVALPASSGITSPGKYALWFANVDDRLTLRVNNELPFGEGVDVEIQPGEPIAPTVADLSPVAVASQGAEVSVSGLVLTRDVYYTLNPNKDSDLDSLGTDDPIPTEPVAFFDWLANPKHFANLDKVPSQDYPIAPGRYMMLGDNSPASRDGRLWELYDQIEPGDTESAGWDSSGRAKWEVPESLLIGKAFCVYWPHLKPIWPAIRLGPNIRLPAIPNFGRMRWIR